MLCLFITVTVMGFLHFSAEKKNNEGVKDENCYMSENKIV